MDGKYSMKLYWIFVASFWIHFLVSWRPRSIDFEKFRILAVAVNLCFIFIDFLKTDEIKSIFEVKILEINWYKSWHLLAETIPGYPRGFIFSDLPVKTSESREYLYFFHIWLFTVLAIGWCKKFDFVFNPRIYLSWTHFKLFQIRLSPIFGQAYRHYKK